MSTIGGNYSQYGTYQKGYDHNMFWTKNHARVVFAGTGTVTDDKKYLKRIYDNNTQALYIPPETYGSIYMSFVAVRDVADEVAYGTIADGNACGAFANDGGTVAITGTPSEEFVSGYTIAVEANDTSGVDALEVTIIDTGDNEDTIYVYVVLDLYWVNINYHAGNTTNRFPTITTGALTAQETPNA